MKEIHVVGAAIIKDGRVLAAQRSSKMKTPLKWEFAGGKLEEGETHHEALAREVYEELGVRIKVNEFLATGYSDTDSVKIVLHVYEAVILEGIPVSKEHEQLKWVGINKIVELDWADADIPACLKLVEIYREKSNL